MKNDIIYSIAIKKAQGSSCEDRCQIWKQMERNIRKIVSSLKSRSLRRSSWMNYFSIWSRMLTRRTGPLGALVLSDGFHGRRSEINDFKAIRFYDREMGNRFKRRTSRHRAIYVVSDTRCPDLHDCELGRWEARRRLQRELGLVVHMATFIHPAWVRCCRWGPKQDWLKAFDGWWLL